MRQMCELMEILSKADNYQLLAIIAGLEDREEYLEDMAKAVGVIE